MSFEAVDRIAQGRVWTGKQGLKIGLVDRLGNFFDALNVAKKMAHIPAEEHVKLVILPKPKSFLERILESTVDTRIRTVRNMLKSLPTEARSIVLAIPYFKTGEPLFLMPYLIDIR